MTYLKFIFILPLLIFFSGCEQESSQKTTLFSDNMMTIDYHIIIGEYLTDMKKEQVQKIISQTFSSIDLIFNKWNPSSEVSKLNQLKANEIIPISSSLEKFLLETQEIVEISGRRFDPTIEPLQKLWKKRLSEGSIPSDNELRTIMPAIGWDKIHFGNGLFYKDHDLTSIDLGGIAKGLCVDWLVENLVASGYKNVYVEWGGEIRTHGSHPNQRPWNIYISRLEDMNPAHAIEHISLINQAVATSGDYLQNWQVKQDGKAVTYFHILDPQTGRPLVAKGNSIASATILAPTCMLADGLATTAMIFPTVEAAAEWLEEVKKVYPSIQFWLIFRQ